MSFWAVPRTAAPPVRWNSLVVYRAGVRKLLASLPRSLVWDRGLEIAKLRTFTVATNANVYILGPQTPWQRDTNENTSRPLPLYLIGRIDLIACGQTGFDKHAMRLNQRPRKTLGFQAPGDKLLASVT